MDSLTQFVLGSTVSVLCLGKTLGPRKAALLGGVLGTMPDLDVLITFDSPVDAFVMHRGWTHSLFVHAAIAPFLGELLMRVFKSLQDHRVTVWWTVFLCFSTHALIDAMTVYGTRLFWPIYRDPVGVGSIFIIDPLYTLPLLGVTIWAIFRREWSSGLARGVTAAMIFSTAYLGLGAVLQSQAENRAKVIFARAGVATDSVFAIAAPFNIVLWKVIGLEQGQYHNIYLSLFDDDQTARVYTHPRHPELIACLENVDAFQKLAWFSRGYYRAEQQGDEVIVSDLRMGLTPRYAFRFAVAQAMGHGLREVPPETASDQPRAAEGDLDWLAERVRGRPAVRQAEISEADAIEPADHAMC
ncbi:MAG: metal-dependent hydrolase [Paracoccaceae bacterium]|nr:metal-dependent hydrolase [Paracoccaceae bacterium]